MFFDILANSLALTRTTGNFTSPGSGITAFKKILDSKKSIHEFQANLSDTKALKALLKGNRFAGVQVAEKKRLKYLLLPMQVLLEANPDEKLILGTGMNDPSHDKPVLLPQDILKSVIVMLAKNTLPEDCKVPHGELFTKQELVDKHPELAKTSQSVIDTLDDDAGSDGRKAALFRFRSYFAVPFGGDPVRGTVNEGNLTALDTLHSGHGAIWGAAGTTSFSADVHAHAVKHARELKEIFPPKERGMYFLEDEVKPSFKLLPAEDKLADKF